MRTDELQYLLDFDAWAMERALATAEQLSPAQFGADPGSGHAAPRATILHCITGMRTWRERLQGAPSTPPPAESDYPTAAAVKELWRTEHGLLRGYAMALGDGGLDEVLEQRRPDRVLRAPRWQYVVHLIFHNMQHRSELAQALTFLGHSPGELGMTVFLMQRSGG